MGHIIRQDKRPEVFVSLVSMGAGKKSDPKTLLDYVNKYLADETWRDAMIKTLKLLCQCNHSFALLYDIREISDVKPSATTIILEGLLCDKRYLKPSIVDQLFAGKQVKSCSMRFDQKEMHFIVNSGLPMVKTSIESLGQLLFREAATVASDLLRIADQRGHVYSVLIYSHIPGINLQKVFKDRTQCRVLKNSLDKSQFTKLILLYLLCNLADGKPEDFILIPYQKNTEGKQLYTIRGIDNTNAFVPALLSNETDRRNVQARNFLFCLDNMQENLDETVCNEFIKLKPDLVLIEWLERLNIAQKRCNQLFSEADRKQLKEKFVFLHFPFRAGMIADIYQKFLQIQSILAVNFTISGITLFKKVIPLLGIVHEEAFIRHSDKPTERFKFLYEHANAPDSKSFLANQPVEGPEAALKELQAALSDQAAINKAKDAFKLGDFLPLRKLLLDDSKDAVLANTDLNACSYQYSVRHLKC